MLRLIMATAPQSDATVLAYCVMPNHLHLVLVQGTKQLCDFMQPLLRRIALLVQRHHIREGHVFERRYNATVCRDPEYLRNAIAYVHLNPVRAGLCDEPGGYAWTSHHEYVAVLRNGTLAVPPVIEGGLRLFSRNHGCPVRESCRDYGAFLSWRVRMDRHTEAGGSMRGPLVPLKPYTEGGDRHWNEVYGAPSTDSALDGYGLDLRDVAANALVSIAPGMDLDQLRSGGRARPLVKVRRQVIVRALHAGYRPYQIARFLNISPSAVALAIHSR